MIYLYSGTPGSGKSLHTARDIMFKLRRGHRVIANFPVNMDVVKKKLFGKYNVKEENFIYKDNSDLTVDYLVKYAKDNHVMGKEGQTLLVIDECSVMFNPREFTRYDRNTWIKFFQHHRKLGYNVILISQNDRLIDRQIRAFIEYDVKHRKANNNGAIGMMFSVLCIKLFVAVNYWYGVREKCGVEFFTYRKLYAKLYDSYAMFDDELTSKDEENTLPEHGEEPAIAGGDLCCGEG